MIKWGRVLCKKCDVIVDEHPIMPEGDYYEYVSDCEYCSPSSKPRPSDVVEKFSYEYNDLNDPKNNRRIIITRTRQEVDKLKEHRKEWKEKVEQILYETEQKYIHIKDVRQKNYQETRGNLDIFIACESCNAKFLATYWENGECMKCHSAYYWDSGLDEELQWIYGDDISA